MEAKIGLTAKSEAGGNQEDDMLSKMDPAFIHQVLLTDPSDFSSLSMPGSEPKNNTYSFETFMDILDGTDMSGLDQHMVVKKAVRDHICEKSTQKPENVPPVKDLLLELHGNIRSLIPNRKDLHSILDDQEVRNVYSFSDLQSCIFEAAQALEKLESAVRGETTRKLLEQLSEDHSPSLGKNKVELWVTAVVYLLYKAELCEADKQNFYLEKVWAPQIHLDGPAYERKLYQSRFGDFSAPDSSPATRQWIQYLLESEAKENSPNIAMLQSSPEARKSLIRAGWIESILFRVTEQKPLHLPEILSYDEERLQILREVTRVAVAGCALALHASNAAGADAQVVLANIEGDAIKTRRSDMLHAMKRRGKSSAQYEKEVVEAVVELAKAWNASFGGESIQALDSRCIAVLRGQDPVLKLLNGRIKGAMRDALVQNIVQKKPAVVPPEMKSGLTTSSEDSKAKNKPHAGDAFLEKHFCQRGLGFFASELATATSLASKIVELAISLYWDELLDKIILENCQRMHDS